MYQKLFRVVRRNSPEHTLMREKRKESSLSLSLSLSFSGLAQVNQRGVLTWIICTPTSNFCSSSGIPEIPNLLEEKKEKECSVFFFFSLLRLKNNSQL